MADLYLTPAEKYTAALGGFYYGDLPEPGTVYTQLIKDILNGATPDKEPKNILARFIYSLYISDLGDPYPRYELAKLLYWKLHNITPTKSGSILTVTIDGKEDYMTINTDLSRLWYKVLFGSKTDIITEFPYIFNTMQNKLSDWELFGNVEVSGTPTPDSPIMPQGTGERTGNLFDKSTAVLGERVLASSVTTDTEYAHTDYINIEGYTYITVNKVHPANTTNIYFYTDKTNQSIGYYKGTTAEIPSGAKYVRINLSPADIDTFMVNSGSTPLPYEPYGYKIPILSNSQTTNVYLGEVESTRRIKKLVLDATESWFEGTSNYYIYLNVSGRGDGIPNSAALSTHTESGVVVNNNGTALFFKKSVFVHSSLADFKSYLAQQYAAGTPVTVWYVLATETTGIVNEPLMRIGDYADSMSRTQTGIDIPTVVGQNTLDVLTTVKPSSMRIEYTSADETRSRSKRISLLKRPLAKSIKA